MSVFMQPIYTQTVTGSPVASITFNNIPQGFSDLHIAVSTRMTNASTLGYTTMRFNDNTTNYSWTYLDANIGSAPFSARQTSYNSWFVNTPAASSTAGVFGNSYVRISDYVGGSFKQGILDATGENNGVSAYLTMYAALFSKTDPITKITFQDAINGANFAVGSTITIYGVSERYDTQTPTAPTIGTVTDQAGFVSVAFTPASNDQADRYAVTTTPSSSTTFGTGSPIVAPAAVDTSYTYQVASVNSLGSSASASSSALTTFNNYTSIASTTVGASAVSSITFTNIPQNYKHLEIRVVSKCTRSGANNYQSGIGMRFNNDNSASYSKHQIISFGATGASGSASQTELFVSESGADGDGAIPNAFGCCMVTIYEYANTAKNKIVANIGGNQSVVGYVDLVATITGGWYNRAPITSITLFPNVHNFKQYSIASLYGVS